MERYACSFESESGLGGLGGISQGREVPRKKPGRVPRNFPTQTRRDFLTQTGMTPQQWLNELRLQKAVEPLARGARPKDVADQFGYNQASHFSRAFKRFHGMTPREVLRRISPPVAQR